MYSFMPRHIQSDSESGKDDEDDSVVKDSDDGEEEENEGNDYRAASLPMLLQRNMRRYSRLRIGDESSDRH